MCKVPRGTAWCEGRRATFLRERAQMSAHPVTGLQDPPEMSAHPVTGLRERAHMSAHPATCLQDPPQMSAHPVTCLQEQAQMSAHPVTGLQERAQVSAHPAPGLQERAQMSAHPAPGLQERAQMSAHPATYLRDRAQMSAHPAPRPQLGEALGGLATWRELKRRLACRRGLEQSALRLCGSARGPRRRRAGHRGLVEPRGGVGGVVERSRRDAEAQRGQWRLAASKREGTQTGEALGGWRLGAS